MVWDKNCAQMERKVKEKADDVESKTTLAIIFIYALFWFIYLFLNKD